MFVLATDIELKVWYLYNPFNLSPQEKEFDCKQNCVNIRIVSNGDFQSFMCPCGIGQYSVFHGIVLYLPWIYSFVEYEPSEDSQTSYISGSITLGVVLGIGCIIVIVIIIALYVKRSKFGQSQRNRQQSAAQMAQQQNGQQHDG